MRTRAERSCVQQWIRNLLLFFRSNGYGISNRIFFLGVVKFAVDRRYCETSELNLSSLFCSVWLVWHFDWQDVRELTPIMKEVLFNTEVIAVNQDPLVQQGDRISNRRCEPSHPATCQVWAKPLSPGNKFAVILYNSADSKSYDITVKFSNLGPCKSPNYRKKLSFSLISMFRLARRDQSFSAWSLETSKCWCLSRCLYSTSSTSSRSDICDSHSTITIFRDEWWQSNEK